MSPNKIQVRFAPSPTGYLHIGGARTALYNYLYARKHNGKMILRIEDTDRNRFVEDSTEKLIHDLKWLGITWDEGPEVGGKNEPYVQSERLQYYQKYATNLLNNDKAYYCFCNKERLDKVRSEHNGYDGHCRTIDKTVAYNRVQNGEKHTIRFKSPRTGTTNVTDLIRHEISIQNEQLDDFILIKTDGFPVYHLAAMVDDHLMNITHVIRGEEWLSSLPKHALIIRALEWNEPTWCHLSVLKQSGGKGKISKRQNSKTQESDKHSIFIGDLRKKGFHPEAIINWMALMGWSLDDKHEDFKLSELEQVFSLKRVNPSPATVNFEKLDHFQGKYVRSMSISDLNCHITPFLIKAGYHDDDSQLNQLIPLIRDRITTFKDSVEWIGFCFKNKIEIQPIDLISKKSTQKETLLILNNVQQTLTNLTTFDHISIENSLRLLAKTLDIKVGQLLNPVRIAISGQKVSPPLFETIEILGKNKIIDRIQYAIDRLNNMNR